MTPAEREASERLLARLRAMYAAGEAAVAVLGRVQWCAGTGSAPRCPECGGAGPHARDCALEDARMRLRRLLEVRK